MIVYLLYGDWIELSLLFLASFGPDSFVGWIDNPTSWIGLHKIIFWVLDFTPISVQFQHSDPGYAEEYHAFFRCPVLFDQDENRIVFRKSDFLRPLEITSWTQV